MATYNKYKYYKRQYLSGDTWVDVEPLELTLSGVSYGTYDTLEDCLNSIEHNYKFLAYYYDIPSIYNPYIEDCDSATTLTTATTRNGNYPYSLYSMTSAEIGDCITSIDNYAFSGFTLLNSVLITNNVTNKSEHRIFKTETVLL